MRPACTNTQAAMLRAATALLADHGEPAPLLAAATARDWASVTFDGRRETLELVTTPAAAALLTADLPDREIPIAGWIVADLSVSPAEGGVRIEALVVRD